MTRAIIICADTVTRDRFNINIDDNLIVLREANAGGQDRSRTHFTFNPENEGWAYLKRAVEFYERARLLDGRDT